MSIRINYLDRIKGFVILLMVIGHIYLFSHSQGTSFVYRFIQSFHMHLFMYISGFVAYINSNNLSISECRNKLVKRFLSYMCPAIMIGIIIYLFNKIILKDNSIYLFDAIEGKASLITSYWYLKCLMLFIIVQFFLVRLKSIFFEIIVVFLFYLLCFIGWKFSSSLNSILCLEHVICFYPFFLLGYYTRRYNLHSLLFEKNWVYTLSLIIYICLQFSKFDNHILQILSSRFISPYCAIIVISTLFNLRNNSDSKIEKWLAYIGRNTLDVYLYSSFFILTFPLMKMELIMDFPLIRDHFLLNILFVSALSIIISYISIWIGLLIKQSKVFNKIVYGKFL